MANRDGVLTLDLYAKETASLLEPPRTRRRTKPLALGHPYHQHHTIEVLLPTTWRIDADHEEIDIMHAFTFTFDAALNGRMLRLDYDTARRRITSRPRLRRPTSTTSTRPGPSSATSSTSPPALAGSGAINWPVLLLGLGVLALAVVAPGGSTTLGSRPRPPSTSR